MILETDADRVLKIITALKYRPRIEWYFFKSVFWRDRLYIRELWLVFICTFCSWRWFLLANFPVLSGFSLVIPTLVRFCLGLHSWWCVLFDGRGTLAVSTELELICSVFCFRDLHDFFPTPTENQYFDTNQLLLFINLSHYWMSLVLSSSVWFWFWSYNLFGSLFW